MDSSILEIILTALASIFGVAVTWGVLRTKVTSIENQLHKVWDNIDNLERFRNNSEPALAHYSKVEDKFENDIASSKSDIITLKERALNMATIKEVREEFITRKELDLHLIHFNNILDTTAESVKRLDNNVEKLTELITKDVLSRKENDNKE